MRRTAATAADRPFLFRQSGRRIDIGAWGAMNESGTEAAAELNVHAWHDAAEVVLLGGISRRDYQSGDSGQAAAAASSGCLATRPRS